MSNAFKTRFKCFFGPRFWATGFPLSLCQLSKKELLWQPIVFHLGHMAYLSELSLYQKCKDAV